jgi:integrase
MGTVVRRGRRWRAAVWMHGIRKGKSFPTKVEATAWLADMERKIAAGQGVAVAGRTFEDLLMRFSDEECPHRKKCDWEQTRILFLCKDEIAKVRLDRLDAEAFTRWQRRQLERVSGETVRRDRNLLSTALRQAVKVWKWLPASPLADVKTPPANPHRNRLLMPGELDRLWFVAGRDLAFAQARAIAAFEFAVETGMRGGEIVALTREHVHIEQSFVHVEKSKNGDERDVALSARAGELLATIVALGLDPVFGLDAGTKDSLFRKMRAKAAIGGLNFHDSRHTACTRLARRLNPLELARHLGMRDLQTLMIYYNESATEIAKRL